MRDSSEKERICFVPNEDRFQSKTVSYDYMKSLSFSLKTQLATSYAVLVISALCLLQLAGGRGAVMAPVFCPAPEDAVEVVEA